MADLGKPEEHPIQVPAPLTTEPIKEPSPSVSPVTVPEKDPVPA